MKLSEAILLGCEYNPIQHRGCYAATSFDGDGNTYVATCALGAAVAGCLGRPITPYEDPYLLTDRKTAAFIQEHTGCYLNASYPIPTNEHDMHYSTDVLFGVISFLNDTVDWTREQIAAWLAEQGL